MLRFIISAVLALVAMTLPAATAVQVSPGTLESQLAEPDLVTDLALSGSVDARDLFFIADKMPALKSLDLTSASIEAYEGPALRSLVQIGRAHV